MWQVSVLMRNGAVVMFGLQAENKHQAELRAFERAPYGNVADLIVTPILPRKDRLG